MNLVKIIHNLLSLLHCIISTLVSIYLMPIYLSEPMGNMIGTNLIIFIYFMKLSISYFILSTIFILFLEPHTKKTIQYLGHHIMTISMPLITLKTQNFMNAMASCYIMECSTIFLTIRELLRYYKICNIYSQINEIIFVITFFLCRFTIPFYMCYYFYTNYIHDLQYYFIVTITTLFHCLNFVWAKEIIGMIKRKYYRKNIKN
jgi:hypothetical protein